MANIIECPIICTRGAIIFPGQDMSLDVGRRASVDVVNFSLNMNLDVILVSQKNIDIDEPKKNDLYEIGTICHIRASRKRDDHLKVVFVGEDRCRLIEIYEIDGIKYASVEVLSDVVEDDLALEVLKTKVKKEYSLFEQKNGRAPLRAPENMSNQYISELVDGFAQANIFNSGEKQKFLEEYHLEKRLEMFLTYISLEKKKEEIEKEINLRVKDSVESSQKDYYLRERIKAIKEELGDGQGADVEKLKEEFSKDRYPENIKAKANEEIRRLDMTSTASGEYGMIRTYLDWLISIPWTEKSVDETDLTKVKEVLDEDHYGLEKIKTRILEYLAVKELSHSLKSPIICLVGPPGVGKTSLAKSIARALNRNFVKMSLGGVRDEAEIRGHRRTYLGSYPGRIIQGMKKAGTTNPVFLIDEIDKMGADYKGDPSSAMLEVLDPEQNSMFQDHYLEETYDLSDVMFIATANYLENIPAPLLDRLEIINLSSYTELEKLNICKDHLIPKVLKKDGLKPSQFSISDEMITHVIRHYTRESGVRELERMMETLARKATLEIYTKSKRSIKVTKKLVQEWLGHEKFEYGTKEKKNQVGVVTGLAYTAFGGDILQIEVNYFEGKGKLIITGQLGDVMKESAEIALDYVKSNAKKFGIDVKFFETHDIHIHVPEGAVPKDGPSAGVTLTTAFVSALTNKAVDANCAMTGEVTLRGNVLPIGGLREKSIAANRSGITKVFIPKGNVKDIDELPDIVKENITFMPVDKVDTILKEAIIHD
ncbi:MAG: endopeptidase La [Solobacterium sp.]|nr:endopeptidase La [Solobacterium sp.]MDY2953436.1 endopeptidase La [Erysipelotrichaceae bacterium]MCI6696764.1 endopeptidase La [Solobacterium sp.]MCI6877424.1 endopeptidase La [Solobacterium sp.]MDD7776234.1 endopeptidase La [Solobacterium sp.]